MSRRTCATPSARSGRWASWLMRSLPRMNLTSSVMGVSLLAQPGIDERLSARCRAGVEHVPDRLLVEPDQREHDLVAGGEPADDPDGHVGVVGMGDAPQLVAAGLP